MDKVVISRNIVLRELSAKTQADTITLSEHESKTIILLARETTDYHLTVKLAGDGARADILGLIAANKQSSIKINTLQLHEAPHTVSDLHFKSILLDRAYFEYEGFIRIEKPAQGSNAYQRNDNLILSKEAKAESRPALEILANDVRCTHGATLGRLDPEQKFYLQSRGLTQKQAEALIIEGYFLALCERLSDTRLTETLLEKLAQIYHDKTHVA